jgi:hypothetical protein
LISKQGNETDSAGKRCQGILDDGDAWAIFEEVNAKVSKWENNGQKNADKKRESGKKWVISSQRVGEKDTGFIMGDLT